MASRTSSTKEKKPLSKKLWDFLAGNNTVLPIPKFARMVCNYYDMEQDKKASMIKIAHLEDRIAKGAQIINELEACKDPVRAIELQKKFNALHK